jgi:hypothetical protein
MQCNNLLVETAMPYFADQKTGRSRISATNFQRLTENALQKPKNLRWETLNQGKLVINFL